MLTTHKTILSIAVVTGIVASAVVFSHRGESDSSVSAALIAAKGGNTSQSGGQGNAGGNGQGGEQGGGQGNSGGNGQGNQGGNGVGGGEGGGQENNNGVGQGEGGGQENNNGVGQGEGGGRDNNRGNNDGNGNAGGNGGAGGGADSGNAGGNGVGAVPGRGLRQHASAFNQVLNIYGLHKEISRVYTYKHPSVRRALHTAADQKVWEEDLHNVTCSMYRYLKQMRTTRPELPVFYVDWIIEQVARALGEDFVEVKAALLGYPHHHEEGSLLNNITESGCARGDEVLPFAESQRVGEEHTLTVSDSGTGVSLFSIEDVSTGTGLVFRVLTATGAVFSDYTLTHGSEMHLFVFRDDVQYFHHLHPTRDAEQAWRAPFTPPAPGTYWFYADFVDKNLQYHTIRFQRTYEGETGAHGFTHSAHRTGDVDGYTVSMWEEPYSDGILLTFHIADKNQKAVVLDTYDGTLGHALLLSPDGDFIATYSSYVGDHLTFQIPKDLDKPYRIFAMFRVGGVSHTAAFDWVPGMQGDHDELPAHEH